MSVPMPRTDLAVEAHRVRSEAAGLDGVSVRETEREGFRVTTVEVRSPAASQELCKPIGHIRGFFGGKLYQYPVHVLLRSRDRCYDAGQPV